MSKKILITGASGFVGFHLIEKAHEAGFEVHAAVRKSSNIKDIEPYVRKFVYPDFNCVDNLVQLFEEERYDYVIHAAAMTKAKSEAEMFNVNVGYTEHLLKAAFEKATVPPKQFVFVSSLAAVGPVKYEDSAITENNPYNPVTVYGRSKKAAEGMIHEKFLYKPITIIRPTAVYGPREKDIFILFETMNKGLDAYIGKNPQKLSFVYVLDLVDALLRACENNSTEVSTFNITDGNVYSRYAMADIFAETLGKKMWRVHLSYPLVEKVAMLSAWFYKNSKKTPVLYPERLNELTAQNWACDIQLAKEKLGFTPKYDLQTGLKESLLWYKKNNWF